MTRGQLRTEILAIADENPQEDVEIKNIIERHTSGMDIPEQQDARVKLRTVLMELKDEKEITFIDEQMRQLATLSSYNFIRFSLAVRTTNERTKKQKEQDMKGNYSYKILEILFENKPNKVNLRPRIMEWIEEDGTSRQNISNVLSKLQTKGFIRHEGIDSLSFSYNNGVYDDKSSIEAKIEDDGILEYTRQKDILYPKQSPPPFTIQTFGKNSPAAGGNLHQEFNKPDKEGIRISRKQLTWTIVLGLLALLIALLAWLV